MSNSKSDIMKIVIAGLNDVGKTSIVMSLSGRINLLDFLSIEPTKSAEISNIYLDHTKYNIWDLGGQSQYRNDYIENFNEYFKGAQKLIYVIDVQGIDKYDLAIDYLQKILAKLRENEITISTDIFLHKFDPNLFEMHPEVPEEKVDELLNTLNYIMAKEDHFYQIFETTIYTTFEKKFAI
ncbi:MAG: hypothetical protein GF383_16215 [Candidatus Lokiarchaeota archaeon]|nr:hypothetical protein [Candidatus Lokiarchaeota archaeon]MBD3343295.1 hypothetical protein [Candidatus Lokiarchaeota archaeon]